MIKDVLLLGLFIFCGSAICLLLGQDASWDFANYHYYSVWALFNNRIGFDIMPSGVQSYFNPLMDFPLYFYIKLFNNKPYIVSILQSIPWGVTVFFAYKIISIFFTGLNKKFFIVLSLILGTTGVLSIFQIGLSFNDLTISFIALLSIYIILSNIYNSDSKKRTFFLFFAGLILGLGTGLKTSGIFFFVGIFLTLIFLFKDFTKPIKIILMFLLGFLIGFSITGLWWYILIYKKFANPFFPLMNNIFKSEYALKISHADIRKFPNGLIEYLFYPFIWTFTTNMSKVFESPFFDLRWLLIYLFSFISIIFFIFEKKSILFCNLIKESNKYFDFKIFKFLIFMFFFSYIFWLNTSCVLRYIIAFEFISGLYILPIVILLFSSRKKLNVFISCFLVFCVLVTMKMVPLDYLRIKFSDKFISLPNLNLPDNSLVLLLGGFPATFFIPFQNPKAKFIYLYGETGFSYYFKHPLEEDIKIKKMIEDSGKNVYLLYSIFDPAPIKWDIIDIYIDKNDFSCSKVENMYYYDYYFCSLKNKKL